MYNVKPIISIGVSFNKCGILLSSFLNFYFGDLEPVSGAFEINPICNLTWEVALNCAEGRDMIHVPTPFCWDKGFDDDDDV